MVARTLLIAGAALLAAFAAGIGPAAAQQDNTQRGNGPQNGAGTSFLFRMFDTNHDGVIDKTEAAAVDQAVFAAIDTDGNGQLSQAELGTAVRDLAARGGNFLRRLQPNGQGPNTANNGNGGKGRNGTAKPNRQRPRPRFTPRSGGKAPGVAGNHHRLRKHHRRTRPQARNPNARNFGPQFGPNGRGFGPRHQYGPGNANGPRYNYGPRTGYGPRGGR